MSRPPATLESRLWPKVSQAGDDPVESCWPWTGKPNAAGYGRINKGRRGDGVILAHRAVYEALVGLIPDDLVIDHLCRNPICVNPWHLEPVPQSINAKRGNAHRDYSREGHALKTHCPQGHQYDEANTYTNPRKGGRQCRSCSRARAATNRERKSHAFAR
jgi:hypothetical protein